MPGGELAHVSRAVERVVGLSGGGEADSVGGGEVRQRDFCGHIAGVVLRLEADKGGGLQLSKDAAGDHAEKAGEERSGGRNSSWGKGVVPILRGDNSAPIG